MITRKEIAIMIRSNFRRLTESDIIGRIMLLSNKKLDDAVKGYEILKSEGRLDNFVEPKTDGKFIALLERYPNLKEMIDRLDMVPGKMEASKDQDVTRVKATNIKNLIERLNLPDF